MSKNPILTYGLIAVLGVFFVIIASYVGVNHRNAAQNPENDAESFDLEAIYKNQCAVCHGDDMSGDSAPTLLNLGSKFSEDEIKEIIIEGRVEEGMPAGLVNNEQAALIAEWLFEMESGN